MRSFLRHRTRDGEAAAELLAETFAAAWTARARFKAPAARAPAAVAVALIVGLGVGNEPPASAARQLQHAARLVSGDPAPVIEPGQYWYVKNEVGTREGTFTALQTASHELWIDLGSSGRIVRKDGAPQFFSPAERARWKAAGSPGFGSAGGIDSLEHDLAWGWETLGVHSGRDVPTDPTALAGMVERAAYGTKNPLPWEEFAVISDVLRFAPLSGAQTAAFYQVLATLPGIQLVGPTTDPLGRAGTAFAVERGDAMREELILDAKTGHLLGSRTSLVTPHPAYPDAPAGTVIAYGAIVASGVVGSTDARP